MCVCKMRVQEVAGHENSTFLCSSPDESADERWLLSRTSCRKQLLTHVYDSDFPIAPHHRSHQRLNSSWQRSDVMGLEETGETMTHEIGMSVWVLKFMGVKKSALPWGTVSCTAELFCSCCKRSTRKVCSRLFIVNLLILFEIYWKQYKDLFNVGQRFFRGLLSEQKATH